MNPFRAVRLRDPSHRRGQATIEFIFILPLLFSLILVIFEFAMLFIQVQRVSALSREIANAAFRDCATLAGAPLDDCLDDITDEVRGHAGAILSDFDGRGRILLTVLSQTLDEDGNRVTNPVHSSSAGSANHPTRYTAGNRSQTILDNQQLVVIGETFYNYQPVTVAGGLIGFLLPQVLYEITIY